jgi:acyl-coenzyme A thioesterase PaaI-like protein
MQPLKMDKCLQERYAPHNACFGCGPANTLGLQLKSFVKDDEVTVATWQPQPHHEAFEGILNGGVIGALLDCHSNWTAAFRVMQLLKADAPPCTVTSYFNVTLKRPTSSNNPVHLSAKVKDINDRGAIILAELTSSDKICALCEGQFIVVKPGHPAYRRW